MAHDREKLQDFARSYTEAWCSGDPARVATHFARDGSIAINCGPPTPVLDVATSFMADFPEMQLLMDDVLIRDDDVVEFHWTLIGEHAGTGSQVRISGYEEWTIGGEGLVTASLGNFDAAEYERQVAHGVDVPG